MPGERPGLVVAGLTARKAARSGILWGYVFALTVASSALGYASTYKTPAQRRAFASIFGSNAGLSAINGPAHDIRTVGGYTVWKSLMFLVVLGAVWGLLLGTRMFRGEEDAGRSELLLAGLTTPRRAASQALAGLACGAAVLWAIVAVATVLVGRSAKVGIGTGAALFFSLALVAAPLVFFAAGALASQLAGSRRQAAGICGAFLGISYALRMVADSGAGLDWLRSLSPIGWIEELQPVTSPRPLLLLPIGALVVLLAALAVHLAGVRDLGSAPFPERVPAAPRTRLLGGPAGLALRLGGAGAAVWAGAIAATALLMGFIAKEAGRALAGSSTIEHAVARLGVAGGGAGAYLGIAFLMVALLVGFVAAGQMTAARAEEADGRLDHLLVRPVSRSSWLLGRVAATAATLAGCGLLAGLAAWLGAASQHTGLGAGTLVAAGLNVVPPALCVLAAGVLALGALPRGVAAATYGLLAWSFLVDLVGGLFGSDHWLLDLSLFHQMAPAPAVRPDWRSAGALLGVAAAAIALGTVLFSRRDLAPDRM